MIRPTFGLVRTVPSRASSTCLFSAPIAAASSSSSSSQSLLAIRRLSLIPSASVSTSASTSAPATASPEAATPLAYLVSRTPSRNLPVYERRKRGGNWKETVVRKVDGDAAALRRELVDALAVDPTLVKVNQLTKQVIVRGHMRGQVVSFLEQRGL